MVFVTIKEGFQQDYALSVGRISKKFIRQFNLKIGEVVELISGEKRVPIRLRPIEEIDLSSSTDLESFADDDKNTEDDSIYNEEYILYLNGFLRSNLNVALGQQINLDKTNYQIAKEITVAAIDAEDKTSIYSDYFVDRPLIPGQTLELTNDFGRDIVVVIVKSTPIGITVADKNTEVFIANDTPQEILDKFSNNVVMYDDVGGYHDIKKRLRSLVEIPLRFPEIFDNLNITPPLGILITGARGTGKTILSKAVSHESGVHRFFIMATEIVKGWWESELEMDKYFSQIVNYQPAVVVIDQIDVLAPIPSLNTTDLERRLTERLITNLTQLKNKKVIIIGTCENSELIHPSLKTYGRFEVEINIPIPNNQDRLEIMKVLTRGIPLESNINFDQIIKRTQGFTASDLELLIKESGIRTLKRFKILDYDINEKDQIEGIKKLSLSQDDIFQALSKIKPGATKEFTNQIPNISWEDIGGLEEVKQAIRETIAWPIHNPEVFTEMGIKPPKGILLYGPPGTGKTLVAKAIANQINSNFLVVKGPELISKWFSETPRQIRELFKKARQLAPCIVFFDELDALAPVRSGGTNDSSGGQERDRVINQLLTTIDGIDAIKGVFVIGATNRPTAIDPALLRPGRIDRLIYVPVPNEIERLKILEVHTKSMKLNNDVDLKKVANKCPYFTGADIQSLCRESVFSALRKDFTVREVSMIDFKNALRVVFQSVPMSVLENYKILSKDIRRRKVAEYISKGIQEFV